MATDNSLHRFTIDYDPDARIDKNRAHRSTVATLHPAVLKDAGEPLDVVAKIITIRGLNRQAVDKLKRCAEIHRLLSDHPCIVKLYGIQQTPTELMLFLEKAEGSLRDIISPETEAAQQLKEKLTHSMTLRDIIFQIVQALKYVHSKTDEMNDQISHRDIKPENFLIVTRGRDGAAAIKLTDFDSATQLDADETVTITTGAMTEMYMSPALSELLSNGLPVMSNNYADNDGYAIALVIYELLTEGQSLFQGKNKNAKVIMANMQNNNRDNLLKADIDELAKNLIWTLTQSDPERRISMATASKVPYFKEVEDHLQMINTLSEAFLEMDDSSKETREIKDELNRSFFMLFQTTWKELPFIVPEILHFSKYADDVVAFLRFCRNLLAHAEQHQKALKRHFGTPQTAADLLKRIVEKVRRFLVHFYWIAAKRFPSKLDLSQCFPPQCVSAYEDVMKIEREKIGESNIEKLYQEVCRKPKPQGVQEQRVICHVYEACKQDVRKALRRTDAEFKDLEDTLKVREEERKAVLNDLERLEGRGGSRAEIEAKKAQLVSLDKSLEMKRWLDLRNIMRDPEKFLADVESRKREVAGNRQDSGINLGADVRRREIDGQASGINKGAGAATSNEHSSFAGRITATRVIACPNDFPTGAEVKVVAVINKEILVWSPKPEYRNTIHFYNFELNTWRTMPVTGELPSIDYGQPAVVTTGNFIYIFGGSDNDNNIYVLMPSSGTFRRLPANGLRPQPRKGLQGWSHENKLYFFGGLLLGPSGSFLVAPEKQGLYDNLLAEFDLQSNQWRSVDTDGPRPKPRAIYAAAKSGNRVFIHGGISVRTINDYKITHDFHFLDMTTKMWTKIENAGPSLHSHTLTAATEKRLFIIGGGDDKGKPPNKVWQFNLEGCFWKEEKSLQKGLASHLTVAIKKQNGVSLVSLGGRQSEPRRTVDNTEMIMVDIE